MSATGSALPKRASNPPLSLSRQEYHTVLAALAYASARFPAGSPGLDAHIAIFGKICSAAGYDAATVLDAMTIALKERAVVH